MIENGLGIGNENILKGEEMDNNEVILETLDRPGKNIIEENILAFSKRIISATDIQDIVEAFVEMVWSGDICEHMDMEIHDFNDHIHRYGVHLTEEDYHIFRRIDNLGVHHSQKRIKTLPIRYQDDHMGQVYLSGVSDDKALDVALRHMVDYVAIALKQMKRLAQVRTEHEALTAKHFHVMKRFSTHDKKHQQLLKLSYTDRLTQVYNRRFYEENLKLLDQEMHYPLGIIIADINSLKVFNDAFGHDIGDELIQLCAKTLKGVCEESGSVSRIGGDEFAVLLPGSSQSVVEQLIQQMEAKLSAINALPIAPSISFGSAVHDGTDKLQHVIRHAEDQMYEQKLLHSCEVKDKIISSLKEEMHHYMEEEEPEQFQAMSEALANALGMSPHEKKKLMLLTEVHNIGKVGLDRKVFQKNKKLTLKEMDLIRSHVKRGYRIVSASHDMNSISEDLLCHHERWDGKGYPRAIKGEDIPEVARAFSIIDAYFAMKHHRPYRKDMTQDEILTEMKAGASKQFDPKILQVFIDQILLKE